MTRTGTRRMWIMIVLLLLAGAYSTMRKAQEFHVEIASEEARREQLARDLRAGNLFSAALADLDNFTINEKESTTLDILRYLNLEESTIKYETRSHSVKPIAGTKLNIRQFSLSGNMAYAEALGQVDWLHNTNKVVIERVNLSPGNDFGDNVLLRIEGTLYGLNK